MLPINHLKKTLDRCCGQWEFVTQPICDAVFTVRFLNTGAVHQAFLADGDDNVWLSCMLVDGMWETSNFLSSRLNGLTRGDDGKPTPLVTTDLLTGKKGLLSFATQELKDDFLRHAAPVMESPDKEAAE